MTRLHVIAKSFPIPHLGPLFTFSSSEAPNIWSKTTKVAVENELTLFKGISKYKIWKILRPEKYKENSHC